MSWLVSALVVGAGIGGVLISIAATALLYEFGIWAEVKRLLDEDRQ